MRMNTLLRALILTLTLAMGIFHGDPLMAGGGQAIVESSEVTPFPDNIRFYNEDTEEAGSSSIAEWLFEFAMGRTETGRNTCMSCDFMTYFMTGVLAFGQAIFDFWMLFFPVIAPALMLIWLGYRVAKLAAFGGEDGLGFVKDAVTKLSLFAIIFMIATAGSDRFLWNTVGPRYLDYAFTLSADLRNFALSEAALTNEADTSGPTEAPFGCAGVTPSINNATLEDGFMTNALQTACVVERSHAIGVAAGAAVTFSALSGHPANGGFTGAILHFYQGIMKVMVGLALMAAYMLSSVWLMFLILDIIVEVLIVAAFSPVGMLAYLWKPTRGFATKMITMIAGSMATAATISIVSVLAYYLLGNVLTVYNAMYSVARDAYPNIRPVSTTGFDGLAEFIRRTQLSGSEADYIPLTVATPWFIYLIMAGISIFALGKKMMTMISQITGVGGNQELANKAKGMFTTGMKVAAGGAAMGLMAGGALAGAIGPSVAGAAGGAAGRGLGAAGQGAIKGASALKGRMTGGQGLAGVKNMADSAIGGKGEDK